MDELFSDTSNWNNMNTKVSEPCSMDPFAELKAPPLHNDILDLFENTNKRQDIEYPAFFQSKHVSPTKSKLQKRTNNSTNNTTTDILWDYIDHPDTNNDTTQLFSNIMQPTPKVKSQWFSNIRPQGMITKAIKQINKITPAAKQLISSYFAYQCFVDSAVIVPECVEILSLMYLGHPVFIRMYLGDTNAEPLPSSHKLFVVYGYHTLHVLFEEYMQCNCVIQMKNENKKQQSNAVLNEYFSETFEEKEKRIWRRDIKMPIPPYNGSYREMFDHIDELFFSENVVIDNSHNTVQIQYNDWDEFLEIDESKKEKKKPFEDDDWEIVDRSIDVLFDSKTGLPEIEILIEQKDALGDWIRPYEPPSNRWGSKPKDITHASILNTRYYK